MPRNRKTRATGVTTTQPVTGAAGFGDSGGFIGTVREPFTGAWQMNKECTAQTALAFSGVYACVMTIADDVSKMPMTVNTVGENGIAQLAPTHWAVRLFRKPNRFQTGIQFLQQYLIHKLLTGNAYVVFDYDDRNVPVAMYLLDPRSTRPLIADGGDIYYQISASRANGDALAGLSKSDVVLPASRVLHDRMATVFHPLIGVSPLFAAGSSAQAGYSILQNSKAFFANMSRASGTLTAPGKISKETAERLASKWKQNFGSGNIGQVAVLGDGMKWEPMVMTAVDAQLIDQLRWSVEDVARVFRVPMFMLGDLTKVTYRNSEQLARTYYQSTLQWHLESIESAFDKFFEFTASTFLVFDLDALFRTDSETRFKVYQTALAAGLFSINEVRAKENYLPVPGGEEPRVQMQYVPLSKADGVPEPEPEPVTDEETEEPPEDETDDETETEELAARQLWQTSFEGLEYV